MKRNDFALSWFKRYPFEKFTPEQIRELLAAAYYEEYGETFGDPGRSARQLVREGQIQKSSKGANQVFWYDPTRNVVDTTFTEAERIRVFERDGHKCVICKKGPSEGVPIFVGYSRSIQRGGSLDVENGRTMCGSHKWILETAQDSSERSKNIRDLADKLPKIENSSRALKFWDEFVALLARYGIHVGD
jgi:hypothetical protein